MAKGIAVGLTRGHIVSKIEVPSWVPKKQRKMKLFKHSFNMLINLFVFNYNFYLIPIYYFSKKKSQCCKKGNC